MKHNKSSFVGTIKNLKEKAKKPQGEILEVKLGSQPSGSGNGATKRTHFRKLFKQMRGSSSNLERLSELYKRFDLLCALWDEDPDDVLVRRSIEVPPRPQGSLSQEETSSSVLKLKGFRKGAAKL